MSAAVTKIPGAHFTGLPMINDPMVNVGTEVLMEPGSKFNTLSGVPASGGLIPNLAWASAAALIGSGDATTLSSKVLSTFVTGVGSGKDGVIERTAKGGIHFIVSQVNDVSGHLYQMQMASAISAFISANGADDHYMSMWIRNTRPGVAGSAQNYARLGQSSSNYYGTIQENSAGAGFTGVPAAGKNLGNDSGVYPGPTLVSFGATEPTSLPITMSDTLTFAGAASSGVLHHAPSYAFYRLTVENLAKSGRTYVQARAQDAELFNEAFGVGGRYYNDTLVTQPSAVP